MFTQVSENPTKEEDHTFIFIEIDAEMDAPVLEGHYLTIERKHVMFISKPTGNRGS